MNESGRQNSCFITLLGMLWRFQKCPRYFHSMSGYWLMLFRIWWKVNKKDEMPNYFKSKVWIGKHTLKKGFSSLFHQNPFSKKYVSKSLIWSPFLRKPLEQVFNFFLFCSRLLEWLEPHRVSSRFLVFVRGLFLMKQK